jgi:hypothetical protein
MQIAYFLVKRRRPVLQAPEMPSHRTGLWAQGMSRYCRADD